MFTKEQIEEIKDKLNLGAVKDTDFDVAEPLDGEETVAIVQGDKNVRIKVSDLIDDISVIGPGEVTLGDLDAVVERVDKGVEPAASVYLSPSRQLRFGFTLPKGDPGIAGPIGPRGVQGPAGPQGPQGPAGPSGSVAITSVTKFVYKSSPEHIRPEAPHGGEWDSDNNTFIYPEGWSGSDEIERPVWMSSKIFYSDADLDSTWSIPILISGSDGENGADGTTIEFAFWLSNSEATPTVDTSGDDTSVNDYMPKGPEGVRWSDSPKGISLDNKYEWVISRRKVEGSWSDFSEPAIWSKWGVNGTDGDGVDYIYKVTTGESPSNPAIPSDYLTNPLYQTTEYIPQGWTDNPSGVSPSNPCEFVCVRNKINGVWGSFSTPALWAHYGSNGIDGTISRSLYMSTENTTTPNYDPNGTLGTNSNLGWLSTYTYTPGKIIWQIDAFFNKDSELIGRWTEPRIISGFTGTLEVPLFYTKIYFCSPPVSGLPVAPNIGIEATDTITVNSGNNTYEWLEVPNSSIGKWYSCVAKVKFEDNTIVEWGSVTEHTGDPGEATPSDSWEIRWAVSENSNPPSVTKTQINPNNGVSSKPWKDPKDINLTDVETRNLYLWEITTKLNATKDGFSTQLSSQEWYGPYLKNGRQGAQGLIGDTGATGSTGIAGVGFDEKYSLGTKDNPSNPLLPNDRTNPSPTGWNDSFPTTNELQQYVWCIKSKLTPDPNTINGYLTSRNWSDPFKVNAQDGRDGEDGTSPVVVVLSNPTDVVIADSEGKLLSNQLEDLGTEFSIYHGNTKVTLLLSKTTITATEGITYSTSENDGKIKVTITNISDTYSTGGITFKYNYAGTQYSGTYTIKKIKASDKPYTIDLDEDSITIPISSTKEILKNDEPLAVGDKLYYENVVRVYEGITELPVTNIEFCNYNGNTTSQENAYNSKGVFLDRENTNSNATGKFRIGFSSIFSNNTSSERIYLKVTYSVNNTTRSSVVILRALKLAKGKDAVWYSIVSNDKAIIVDPKTTTTTPTTVSVTIVKHTGDSSSVVINEEELNGYTLHYKIDDSNQSTQLIKDSNTDVLTYTLPVETWVTSTVDLEKKITLELKKTNELMDLEVIPIITNGLNGVSFKLEASTDIIQWEDEEITIPSGTDKKVNITINKYDGNGGWEGINITNLADFTDSNFLYGLNFYCYVDGELIGEENNSYDPAKYSIQAGTVTREIEWVLMYTLGNVEEPFVWDRKVVRVIKPIRYKRNQIVYPAGSYNSKELYTTTEDTAPYVQAADGTFWVLNKVGSWRGEYDPEDAGRNVMSPHSSADLSVMQEGTINSWWVKMEKFNAMYASIGIFDQALVGNAVFWDRYIFSQQGKTYNGVETNDFENWARQGNLLGNGEFTNPWEYIPTEEESDNNTFYPKFSIDCVSGEITFGVVAGGKPVTIFNRDGSGHLAKGAIAWDANGNLNVIKKTSSYTVNDRSNTLFIKSGYTYNIALSNYTYAYNNRLYISFRPEDFPDFTKGSETVTFINSKDFPILIQYQKNQDDPVIFKNSSKRWTTTNANDLSLCEVPVSKDSNLYIIQPHSTVTFTATTFQGNNALFSNYTGSVESFKLLTENFPTVIYTNSNVDGSRSLGLKCFINPNNSNAIDMISPSADFFILYNDENSYTDTFVEVLDKTSNSAITTVLNTTNLIPLTAATPAAKRYMLTFTELTYLSELTTKQIFFYENGNINGVLSFN